MNDKKIYETILKTKNKKASLKQKIDLVNLTIEEYCTAVHFLYIPSVYGLKIQNKIIENNSLQKLKPTDNKGDCTDLKFNYEIKTSSYSKNSEKLTIKNIRPWQDIDYYIFVIIEDNEIGTNKVNFLKCSKNNMNEIYKSYCFINSHGTKEVNKENNKMDKSLHIPKRRILEFINMYKVEYKDLFTNV